MSSDRSQAGGRQVLSSNLAKAVKYHFHKWSAEDVATFTFERAKSSYHRAKAELRIFNAAGTLVIEGREFGGGDISLWVKAVEA